MQRGAAKTPTSTPSTPISKPAGGGSSTPRLDSAGPSTSVTGTVAPETPTIEEPALIASEEPYRWTTGRSTKPVPASGGVKFETSYLPFIDQFHRDDSPEAGPSKGGGGRMVFGYKEPEQEDLEKDEDAEEHDEDVDVIINVKKEKEREKGKREYKKPRPMMNEKGFMRPRSRSRSPERRNGGENGSLLPTSSKHGGKDRRNDTNHRGNTPTNHHAQFKSKSSQQSQTADVASRVKIEPSSPAPQTTPRSNGESKSKKRKPSQSTPSTSTSTSTSTSSKFNINSTGTGTGATISEKKAKLSTEPTMLNDYPTQLTQPSQSTAIDDREAALKAQKKKEKNARKKARKSAE
jgi:hypothetical protein